MKQYIKKAFCTKILFAFIALALFSLHVSCKQAPVNTQTPVLRAAKTYGQATVANLISVYDGDTFKVNIHNYPAIIGENISIRINGIDTPEIRNKDEFLKAKAYEARDFAYKLLSSAQKITLKNMQRGKYFRIIADVILDDTIDLAQELIKARLAQPYDGGPRPSWDGFFDTKNMTQQKQLQQTQ